MDLFSFVDFTLYLILITSLVYSFSRLCIFYLDFFERKNNYENQSYSCHPEDRQDR